MSQILAFTNRYKLHNITCDNIILHAQNIAIFTIGALSFISLILYNLQEHLSSGEKERGSHSYYLID
jgi:hypothetical protein